MIRVLPGAIFWIALTIAFTVLGQLLVKSGTLTLLTGPAQGRDLLATLADILLNWRIILGLACAVVAAFAWIQALARSSLNLAYPFMALAIVLVLALSGVVLGEHVPVNRWVGVAIVCAGIFVASR